MATSLMRSPVPFACCSSLWMALTDFTPGKSADFGR
jgi:hypothetical protein